MLNLNFFARLSAVCFFRKCAMSTLIIVVKLESLGDLVKGIFDTFRVFTVFRDEATCQTSLVCGVKVDDSGGLVPSCRVWWTILLTLDRGEKSLTQATN